MLTLAGILKKLRLGMDSKTIYKRPFVEDDDEDEGYASSFSVEETTAHEDIAIDRTLTVGANHCRTTTCNGDTYIQAQMVSNRPSTHRTPIEKIAGLCRRRPSPPREPLPLLAASIPPSREPMDSPNMAAIRWLQAPSFVSFCQQDNVRAIRLTWSELDHTVTQKPVFLRAISLPDPITLDDLEYRSILEGNRNLQETLSQLSPHFHDFVLDCYKPAHLHRILVDVSKFLVGKPALSDAKIRDKLPS
ncbi:hypothetical protein ACHAO1_010811 [Botrytis cinerea]